jgi:hypothetical protein
LHSDRALSPHDDQRDELLDLVTVALPVGVVRSLINILALRQHLDIKISFEFLILYNWLKDTEFKIELRFIFEQ